MSSSSFLSHSSLSFSYSRKEIYDLRRRTVNQVFFFREKEEKSEKDKKSVTLAHSDKEILLIEVNFPPVH